MHSDAEPKPFVDAVKTAMHERGVGATALSRQVNSRLGPGALSRAKVFRYLNKAQYPPPAIQTAILDVLGIDRSHVARPAPGRVSFTELEAGFVRVWGDCILDPHQVEELDKVLQAAKQLRRKAWGELLSKRVSELGMSGGEFARRIAAESAPMTHSAASMRVSRYLRGLAAPRSGSLQEIICSLLQLTPRDLPPSATNDVRVSLQRSGKTKRIRFDATLPAPTMDDILNIIGCEAEFSPRIQDQAVHEPADKQRERKAGRKHRPPANERMDDAGVKSRRGFAAMSLEKRREIARRGGSATPNEKRGFAADRTLAVEAGRKGGGAKKLGKTPTPS